MENTLINKRRFFLAHFESEAIWRNTEMDVEIDEVTWELKNFEYLDGTDYLEMRSISSITEEDLRTMPLDKDFKSKYSIKAGEIIYGKKAILIEVKVKTDNGGSYYYQELRASQYDDLRSKGIALPWMGLSVEKLIEYGWIKLKEMSYEN